MGVDCLGLVRGVWREIVGPEPETFEPYTPDWAEATGLERLALAGERHFTPVPLDAVAPGDVVPCRELGLDDLRIFRLWGQYKIGHADPVAPPAGPDALGGFEVLARIGASIAPPPAAPAKPAKRTRAGA